MSSSYLCVRAVRCFASGRRLQINSIALFCADPARCRDSAVRFSLDGNCEREARNHGLLRQPRDSALRSANALRKVLLQDLVCFEIVGKRAHAALYA